MTNLAHSFFLSSLEVVINRALPLDPVTEHRVKQLKGKALTIHTHAPEIRATVIFSGDSIQIYNNIDATDDSVEARIEAPAFALASHALRNDDHVIGSEIKISGNRELVQEIHQIVSSLDVDWEEPLSHFIGDAAAHQIGQIGRGIFRWTKNAVRTLITDADDFLHEEAHLVPFAAELDGFMNAVDTVRMDAERLQIRVDRLKQSIESRPSVKQPTKPNIEADKEAHLD